MGAEEWGAVSWWPADMARGALGASGRGHDGAGVRLRGRGERMEMGTGRTDEDGGGSGDEARACQACWWVFDGIHPDRTSVR